MRQTALNAPFSGVNGDMLARMQPATDRECRIAIAVYRKAKAIAEGQGRWDTNIAEEMRVSFTFELSERELEFLGRYVDWIRLNPQAEEPRCWDISTGGGRHT
jgi:hypothetical protein